MEATLPCSSSQSPPVMSSFDDAIRVSTIDGEIPRDHAAVYLGNNITLSVNLSSLVSIGQPRLEVFDKGEWFLSFCCGWDKCGSCKKGCRTPNEPAFELASSFVRRDEGFEAKVAKITCRSARANEPNKRAGKSASKHDVFMRFVAPAVIADGDRRYEVELSSDRFRVISNRGKNRGIKRTHIESYEGDGVILPAKKPRALAETQTILPPQEEEFVNRFNRLAQDNPILLQKLIQDFPLPLPAPEVEPETMSGSMVQSDHSAAPEVEGETMSDSMEQSDQMVESNDSACSWLFTFDVDYSSFSDYSYFSDLPVEGPFGQ